MSTYQELVAQKAELDKQKADLEKQIADALKAERAGVINQIKGLMASHGITLADLSSRVGRPPKAAAAAGAAPEGGTRKVAPKYRDPDTGDTWSGRGLKPKWLTAALESGRTLDDFAL
jgi:DNA-binding protein H-NS